MCLLAVWRITCFRLFHENESLPFHMRGISKSSTFFAALLFPVLLNAFWIDTTEVFSTCMGKNSGVIVISPGERGESGSAKPVLYLLHGYGGDFTSWLRLAPDLGKMSDEYGYVIVCPDGGLRSWYLDSPIDSTFRYETYLTKELIPWIDSNYQTLQKKEFRAISGLSMGGHGAFYIAMKHTDMFVAAGSMSGGLDIRQFTKSWDLKERILGDTICCKQNWEEHTVINIADHLSNGQLKLLFDCGVDDFFIDVNRNLHKKLLSRSIEHEYSERPGKHDSAYWRNSLDYHLLFFKKAFESSTP